MPRWKPNPLKLVIPQFDEKAGTVWVSLEYVEYKLGPTAYEVWHTLKGRVDKDNITQVHLNYLMHARCKPMLYLRPQPPFKRANLKFALEKLRKAGLVINLQPERFRDAKTGKWSQIQPRKVLGYWEYYPTVPEAVLVVPKATWEWMQNVKTYGGARKGAGRKKSIKSLENLQKESRLSTVGALKESRLSTVEGGPEGKRFADLKQRKLVKTKEKIESKQGDKKNQDYPRSSIYIYNNKKRNIISSSKEEEEMFAPKKGANLLASLSKAAGGVNPSPSHAKKITKFGPQVSQQVPRKTWRSEFDKLAPPKIEAPAIPTPEMQLVAKIRAENNAPGKVHTQVIGNINLIPGEDNEKGIIIRGDLGSLPATWPGYDDTVAPPYPGPSLIAAVEYPAPPKLPKHLTGIAAADWLMKMYRGAISSRYDCKCWVYSSRSQLEHSKILPELIEAAELLRNLGISPGAWVAWSVDTWINSVPNGDVRKPTVKWIFSLKRIDERDGWFWQEAVSYTCNQVILTPRLRALVRRYSTMSVAMMRAQRQGLPTREVVNKYFPGETFDDMLDAARIECEGMQEDINREVASGKWLSCW